MPLKSSRWDYSKSGIRGGDLVVMAYRDRYVFGVVGDLGPSDRIGEASYAAAAALGISIRTLRNKLQEYRDSGDPIDVGVESAEA